MSEPTPIPTVRKVCANCRFHEMEQMQGQIMRQMVCHRFPPSTGMVTTPQGIQGITLFPVVQPSNWCYEWQERQPDERPVLDGDKFLRELCSRTAGDGENVKDPPASGESGMHKQ